jgi:hypothetical protein
MLTEGEIHDNERRILYFGGGRQGEDSTWSLAASPFIASFIMEDDDVNVKSIGRSTCCPKQKEIYQQLDYRELIITLYRFSSAFWTFVSMEIHRIMQISIDF